MGWFTKRQETAPKPEPKEDIWIHCPSCKAHIYKEEWEKNFKVCSQCSYHERLDWKERVNLLVDPKTFTELSSKAFNTVEKYFVMETEHRGRGSAALKNFGGHDGVADFEGEFPGQAHGSLPK